MELLNSHDYHRDTNIFNTFIATVYYSVVNTLRAADNCPSNIIYRVSRTFRDYKSIPRGEYNGDERTYVVYNPPPLAMS